MSAVVSSLHALKNFLHEAKEDKKGEKLVIEHGTLTFRRLHLTEKVLRFFGIGPALFKNVINFSLKNGLFEQLSSDDQDALLTKMSCYNQKHCSPYSIYRVKVAAEALKTMNLLIGAEDGQRQIVQLFLQSTSDLNVQNAQKETALHIACFRGDQQIVSLLLGDSRVDANARDVRGWTALHHGACKGHQEIVSLCIKSRKMDLQAEDHLGLTPLQLALFQGHAKVVQALLISGHVDPTKPTGYKVPLQEIAAVEGHEREMTEILAAHTDPSTHKQKNQ